MIKKSIHYILIFFHILLSEDYNLSIDRYNLNENPRNNPFSHLFGITVQFQSDENPETSGNGHFLSEESLDLTYINYPNINRCDKESELVIDLPPHNYEYFSLQMESVKNYYDSISNGNISFENVILENIYQLEHSMSYYAISDQRIGMLFADAIELASNDIENYINQDDNINSIDDILFVVFHAGLGQEASQDFDPTIYDIRSAYIDENMLSDIQQSEYWINDNNVVNGLVLPETLNWIFYDVIEDLFPNTFINENELENLYCEIQIGMTGLFAHLLGYHFGFPVMSDVETGNTRIGKFGLMDVGWSNQAGVIPPRPNPWTRSNSNENVLGWVNKIDKTEELYTEEELDLDIRVVDESNDDVVQFFISDSEYFLIENRSNRLEADGEYSNLSINEIINYYSSYEENYNIEDDDFVHLFDVISYYSNLNGYDLFEIDPIYHVITKVENYDYGLPGSGILIWHIDEPETNNYLSGINNNLNDKSISLEEGDGIEHIGNPNYYLFQDFSKGNKSDFWYSNNEFYQYINYQGYQNQNYLGNDILFDNTSIPNSRMKNNIPSYLAIDINDNISDNMNITAKYNNNPFDVIYLSDDVHVIGNSNEGCIFYNHDNMIYKKCYDMDDIELEQSDLLYGDLNNVDINSRILVDNSYNLYLVESEEYFIDPNSPIPSGISCCRPNPLGYYENSVDLVEIEDALSLGDIDKDGLDEKLFINNGNLYCYNSNGVICEGFPVYGNFSNIPLISDILNNDNTPEIICENDDAISIISNKGDFIFEGIPNFNSLTSIHIVPGWGENTAVLVNGNRLFLFDEYNEDFSYWNNPNSTTYNYPIVTGQHLEISESLEIGIDLSRTYNYPNPITDGYTKFRFFVYNAVKVNINIYDASGRLVDKLKSEDFSNNEYNEIYWDTSKFESGLYFAEVKSDFNQSKLIKVVVL